MKIPTASAEAMQREAAEWQSRGAINSDRDDFGLRCGWFPPGRSVVRFYPAEEDGMVKLFHRAVIYGYKGVGQFVDPEDGFCSKAAAFAKANDAQPPNGWAWKWQGQKVGIAHLVFFEAPQDANLKYVQEQSPQAILFPNRVVAALDRFIAGTKPATLAKHLDPDKPGACIIIEFTKGPQGQASAAFSIDDERELPQKLFERNGEWVEFPPLHETFILDRHPDESQRAQIKGNLKALTGRGSGEPPAAQAAPPPSRPAPPPPPKPAATVASAPNEFLDDDIPF